MLDILEHIDWWAFIPVLGILTGIIAIVLGHKQSMAKMKLRANHPAELKDWQRDRSMILERIENIEFLYAEKDRETDAKIKDLEREVRNLKESVKRYEGN